nr:hypothetical protein [Tanacetum cinerariifolium]
RGVTILVSKPGYATVGSKDLTCEDWVDQMVNTRTDADLSAAVQNALQTLLPQIRAEIREEFCTSFGPSDAVFPSSGAGALEEGVSLNSSDKVVTGATIRITTVMDLTGDVVVTTTAAATTTTLAVTTG